MYRKLRPCLRQVVDSLSNQFFPITASGLLQGVKAAQVDSVVCGYDYTGFVLRTDK